MTTPELPPAAQPVSPQPVELESRPAKIIAWTLGLTAVGILFGMNLENRNNDEAKQNLSTANTCLESYPIEEEISEDYITCIRGGVPGGNSIAHDLHEGEPAEFVSQYIETQADEETFGVLPVVTWGGVGFIVGAFVGYNARRRPVQSFDSTK